MLFSIQPKTHNGWLKILSPKYTQTIQIVRSTQPTQALLVPCIACNAYQQITKATQDSMFLSFFYFLPILDRCLSVSAVGQKHCRATSLGALRTALCFFPFRPPFLVRRTRSGSMQLTAADVAVVSAVHKVRGLFGVP